MSSAATAAGGQRVNLVQGEFHVTDNPDVVLTTLLGSCVAACLYDTRAGVGGMNHFLLPGGRGAEFGVHAMELLVNGLLQRGARRENLAAKLFGGGRMLNGLTDVGNSNAKFAEEFIRRERIQLTGGSLRGERGRRIQFWPVAGRARQLLMGGGADDAVFAGERTRPAAVVADTGGVELF